jgi:hypothetical protein
LLRSGGRSAPLKKIFLGKCKKWVDKWDIPCYNEAILKERRIEQMPTERESNEVKKSMAYDLIQIIEEKPEKETYTAEEVKKLIKVYISTATAK